MLHDDLSFFYSLSSDRKASINQNVAVVCSAAQRKNKRDNLNNQALPGWKPLNHALLTYNELRQEICCRRQKADLHE